MYYLMEKYSDYDSSDCKVVEFSENEKYLEEKAKRLNQECEKLQEIYDNLEELIKTFNDTIVFFEKTLKLNTQDALNRALMVAPFPENIKHYTKIQDNKMICCEIMSNYPEYYVDKLKEADIRI